MKKAQINKELIASVLIVVAVMIVTACLGDYFFDLNDDCLMKDILSGAYTGVPEGHNIQMLYPISLFISLLYRLGSNLDWYGIFLCFCQYFCIFLIIHRLVNITSDMKKKICFLDIFLSVVLGF